MVSQSGFRYYMSFVNAHTRFTWLYLLKSKYDAIVISDYQ